MGSRPLWTDFLENWRGCKVNDVIIPSNFGFNISGVSDLQGVEFSVFPIDFSGYIFTAQPAIPTQFNVMVSCGFSTATEIFNYKPIMVTAVLMCVRFGSWSYDGFIIDPVYSNYSLDLSSYVPCPYRVVSSRARKNVNYYEGLEAPYPDIYAEMILTPC